MVKEHSPPPAASLGWVWTEGGRSLVLIYDYISVVRLLCLKSLLCREKSSGKRQTKQLFPKQMRFINCCWVVFDWFSLRTFFFVFFNLAAAQSFHNPISPQLGRSEWV